MDLGIAGKWALVCARQQGTRQGLRRGAGARGRATWSSRRAAPRRWRRPRPSCARSAGGDRCAPWPATSPRPKGRAAALAACPQVDILVNNAGGPPPGDFRDWDREAWIKALDANMLTPIELIKATVDGMAARGFGRIVNITSSAVKAPIDILGLSNGARSGLTGFVAGAGAQARLAARNVTINNLLPGAFDTDRLRATMAGAAQKTGKTIEAVPKRAASDDPGAALRHARGVRRGLRLPVQRAGGLHHRPERADRRRRLPGDVLTPNRVTPAGIAAPQFQHCSNGPSTRSRQLAADPVPVRRMAQLVEQGARALELASSRIQTSGSAWSGGISPAMLLAYMRCTVAAMPACVSMSAQRVASARLGAWVRRFIGRALAR